jgi:RND family efflux transporter MFP subunit
MKWVALLLAAAASVGTACTTGDAIRTDDKPPEPFALPSSAPASADKAGYIGVLSPREVAEITAPFTTTVQKFSASLGDHVEVGALLAQLDEKPVQEQLAVAKAELKGIQAEVAHSSVSHSAAAAALKREKQGIKEGIASKADVAEAQFKSSEAGTLVSKAIADVEQQKARISALEDKLHHMTLTSPIAGRVSLRYAEAGARVEEGHPVVRVISSDELFVKFAIPADHVGHVTPGDEIEVRIEGRGPARAVVKNVAPELDPVAQMILAEAELAQPVPDKLQSGMVCRIVVPTKQASATPTAPR